MRKYILNRRGKEKMKKKLIVFMLIAAMAFSFAACGDGEKDTLDTGNGDNIVNEEGQDDADKAEDEDEDKGTDTDKNSGSDSAVKPSTDKPASTNKPTTNKPTTNKPTTTTPSAGGSNTSSALSGSLEDIMAKVYDGIEEIPNTAITEVTAENMEYYLGVTDIKFKKAIASEPLMSSIAHSVVLIEVEDGADISSIKSKIKKNVNGRKWVCVGVEDEDILVDNIGNHIILVMDDKSDEFMNNFLNLKGK